MIRVGIIGLGTVGRGTYDILKEHRRLMGEKTGLDIAVSASPRSTPGSVKPWE